MQLYIYILSLVTGYDSIYVSCYVCLCLHLCTELHHFLPPFLCSNALGPGILSPHHLPNSRHLSDLAQVASPSVMCFSAPPTSPSKLFRPVGHGWRHDCCSITSAGISASRGKLSIYFIWSSRFHSVFHIQDFTNQASTPTITHKHTGLKLWWSHGESILLDMSIFWYISIPDFWKLSENFPKWTISPGPRSVPDSLSGCFHCRGSSVSVIPYSFKLVSDFLAKCRCSLNI